MSLGCRTSFNRVINCPSRPHLCSHDSPLGLFDLSTEYVLRTLPASRNGPVKLSGVFLWCRLNPGTEAFVEAGAFVTPVPDHKTNTAGRDIFSWPSEEISWQDTKRIKDSRQNDEYFVKSRNKRQNYRRLNFCIACRGQKWVTVVTISGLRWGRPFHFAFSLWHLPAVLFRFNG